MNNTKTNVVLRKIYSALAIVITLALPVFPVKAEHVAILGSNVESKNEAGFEGFVVPMRNVPTHISKEYVADLTAYTSSVEECDGDPFVTADGSTTKDGIIAVNWLPFNTKIKIPELFGDKIFEVHDRMNTKWDNRSVYRQRIDVWMEKKSDMWQFGYKKAVTIQIIEWGDGKTQWSARAEAIKNKVAVK